MDHPRYNYNIRRSSPCPLPRGGEACEGLVSWAIPNRLSLVVGLWFAVALFGDVGLSKAQESATAGQARQVFQPQIEKPRKARQIGQLGYAWRIA